MKPFRSDVATVMMLLAGFICAGAVAFNWAVAAEPPAAARMVDDSPAQIIILPTATRTPTPINIGNFVWDDLDQDGRQDSGEPGLSGVMVQLWNSSKTTLLDSDVTTGSGSYVVTAPVPGSYRVRVVLPGGNDQFSPKDNAAAGDTADSDINPSGTNLGFTDIISIASNVISISNVDAGIILFRTPTPTRTPTPVNIGNFVWDDFDQDGRQDAGEPGIAGVTVQLWNSNKTALLDQDVTNASGNYTLQSAGPGNFRVRVVLPGLLDNFAPKDNAAAGDLLDSDINPSGGDIGFTDIINIASNVISINSIDVGIIKFRTATPTRTPTPVNIGNFVWNDLDGDGQQDAGEPGLNGITVQLWNTTKTQLISSAITNSNGNYTVIAPLPGSYRVRVILPTGASFAPKDQAGGNEQLDSDINPIGVNAGFTDIFTLASNVISTTVIDAGVINVPSTATYTPTRTPSITPSATLTPTPTQTLTPSLTPTATETVDPSITPTLTLTPSLTPLPSATLTPDPLVTGTATSTPSTTPDPFITDTPEPSLTPSPSATVDPAFTLTPIPTEAVVFLQDTPTAQPTFAYPTPPNTPDCDLRGLVDSDVMRASVRPEHDLFCRTLVEHGEFIYYFGAALTGYSNVGVEALIALNIRQAVDIFSPSGQSYFTGGYVACLQGAGTLIWLDANNAPRRAEIIGSYSVPEWPGFTCATLFTPGTLVLVERDPLQTLPKRRS
jgi:hypothetical protein